MLYRNFKMSLDTSSGAYEQLYDDSAPEEKDKYYEGYIEMKGKFKWSKYWCVLKKKNLHFFKDVNTQIKENYEGYFSLEGEINVELKQKNEWNLTKKNRRITLRTMNAELRDTWIKSFYRSMKGEPPANQSYILPGSGPASPVRSQPSLRSPQHSPMPAGSGNRKQSTDSVRYHLADEQLRNLHDLAKETANNVAMNDAEIKIQEQLLADQSWYQETFRREDVERILADCENGVFIVRDYIDNSTSKKMGYVISLKDQKGECRHHKIVERNGVLFIKGYEDKPFNNLHNLLRFFILSQRKTVVLEPFKPQETNHATRNVPTRTVSVKIHNGSPHQLPSKPRSQSLYQPQSRPVPPVPPPTRDSHDEDTYLNMNTPTSPSRLARIPSGTGLIQQRPLPMPPPEQTEDYYLTPANDLKDANGNDRSNDSYVDMQSPTSPVRLSRIPSGIETDNSDTNSYINVSPLPNPYVNMSAGFAPGLPDRPPVLPPKKRSASVDQAYVNLPARDRPPRPPLRHANTLDR